MTPNRIDLSILPRMGRGRLLHIPRKPYCRSTPESQLPNNPVSRVRNVADVYRVILSFLEFGDVFLVEEQRCGDCFPASGRGTEGCEGRFSKDISGPS